MDNLLIYFYTQFKMFRTSTLKKWNKTFHALQEEFQYCMYSQGSVFECDWAILFDSVFIYTSCLGKYELVSMIPSFPDEITNDHMD